MTSDVLYTAGVQKVLNESELMYDTTPITAREFYLFLDTLPPAQSQPPPDQIIIPGTEQLPVVASPPPVKHIWGPLKKKMSIDREHFLRHTLPQLNESLQDSSANASMENQGEVTIKPLSEAGDFHDWEERVSSALDEHFADYKREEHHLPEEARADVLTHTIGISRNHPELFVDSSSDTITLAGRVHLVDHVITEVNDICQAAEVVCTDIKLPPKYVKYLKKFCDRELQKVHQVQYQFHCEEGFITVQANPKALQRFQDRIDQKAKEGFEESVLLALEAYNLLSSTRGRSKIEEAIPRISNLVYEFEAITPGDGKYSHQLFFLSPDKQLAREAVKLIEPLTAQRTLPLSKEQLNVCQSTDPGWIDCKEQLTREFFVLITVSSDSVVVTGESIVLDGPNNVVTKIKHFLEEKLSVEDRLDYEVSEWRVIKSNMNTKLDAVKKQAQARNVKLVVPKEKLTSKAVFLIQGEPAAVLDIKTQLDMLRKDVQVKVEKVRDIPGLMLILKSLEDRLQVLETKHQAVIEVDIESGDNGASAKAATSSVVDQPVKVLTATSTQYGTVVTIFMGNFTQVPTAGTIINFLSPDPNYRIGSLKAIIDAGGSDVQREIQTRVDQCFQLRYAQVFKTKHGNLKCSQLIHCIIPIWRGGNDDEAEYFHEALGTALGSSTRFSMTVIMSATMNPFNYPVDVFAKKVAEAVAQSALEVAICIEDLSHADEFEKSLQTMDFVIVNEQLKKLPSAASTTTTRPHAASVKSPQTASVRSISSNLGRFITVTKGSLLDVKVFILKWKHCLPMHVCLCNSQFILCCLLFSRLRISLRPLSVMLALTSLILRLYHEGE